MAVNPTPHTADTVSTVPVAPAAPAAELVADRPVRSDVDRFMLRMLRLPEAAPKGTAAEAQKAFQTSLLVATVRCLLMYIVFPFVLPAIGVASGVGPVIGILISVAAITAIIMSIRRFWRADHSKRWHYTVLGATVICFLLYLVVRDAIELIN